jgi:hypothetical protein
MATDHIGLKPDVEYVDLLNEENVSEQDGSLVW